MNLNDVKQLAIHLLPGADPSDTEYKQLEALSTSPQPGHRDLLIAIRNQALEQAAFEWAVAISHAIAAMASPEFWQGADIPDSTI